MRNKSLFVVVPGETCINNCAYCPGRIAPIKGIPCLTEDSVHYSLCRSDYIRRMEFARDNGCNTLIITGKCEPQQSKTFLEKIGMINNELHKPFPIIEMQTTGTQLTKEYLFFLRANIQVTTIALSLAAFDDKTNNNILGMHEDNYINLASLCETIKQLGLNLRLSIHLTEYFDIYKNNPATLFDDAKKRFHADQLILRKLNAVGTTPQAEWVRNHSASPQTLAEIKNYISQYGRYPMTIEFDRARYSLHGMSVVVDEHGLKEDDDGFNKSYVILRSNGKLYSHWNDEGSLIF